MTKTKLFLLPVTAILLGVSVYVHVLTGNAGDKNWVLLATRMWLDGKKLYIDIFDVNPPLVYWIYAVPVYVSMHVPSLSDAHALAIFGLMVCVAVIALSNRLIKYHPQFAENAGRRGQFVLLLLFLFIFYTPNNFFFDREHILLVMTFPYMLRFMPSLSRVSLPRSLSIIIGLLAAVGFCIKPYTIIIFIAVQSAFIVRERSVAILRSPENIIIYVLGALYLFGVWRFTPEYITVVVPMALATYSAYQAHGVLYPVACFVIFGITFVDFRPRYPSPYRREIYYWLCLAVAFLLYALANNGWGYTYYPLIVIGLLLTVWVLWDHLYLKEKCVDSDLPVQPFVFGARACAINLLGNFAYALVGLVSFFSVASCNTNVECTKYALLLNEIKERHIHSFGVMSGDFHKWAQLARSTGATWDTRFRHLWMINKFVVSGEDFTAKHQWILDYLDKAYAEDLSQNKPDAVFVVTGMGVKLPWFFAKSAYFKGAWSHYRYTRTIDLCASVRIGTVMNPDCQYELYERVP